MVWNQTNIYDVGKIEHCLCCFLLWKPMKTLSVPWGIFNVPGRRHGNVLQSRFGRSAVLWSLRSIASGPPVMAQMTWLQYVSGLLWKSHISLSYIFQEVWHFLGITFNILLGKRVVYNTLHGHFPTEHPKSPRADLVGELLGGGKNLNKWNLAHWQKDNYKGSNLKNHCMSMQQWESHRSSLVQVEKPLFWPKRNELQWILAALRNPAPTLDGWNPWAFYHIPQLV